MLRSVRSRYRGSEWGMFVHRCAQAKCRGQSPIAVAQTLATLNCTHLTSPFFNRSISTWMPSVLRRLASVLPTLLSGLPNLPSLYIPALPNSMIAVENCVPFVKLVRKPVRVKSLQRWEVMMREVVHCWSSFWAPGKLRCSSGSSGTRSRGNIPGHVTSHLTPIKVAKSLPFANLLRIMVTFVSDSRHHFIC